MITGTPDRRVEALPPIVSLPIRDLPLPSGRVSWRFAAKSANGLAPRVVGVPALVRIGHWALENWSHTAQKANSAVPLARPVAFDDALPIVSPLASTHP